MMRELTDLEICEKMTVITIKNTTFTYKNSKVAFVWTSSEKSSKCSCGEEWEPVNVNDNRCKKCNGAGL